MISVAALLGTVTAITVGLFSISRIAMTASRDWLLPPILARISPRTQTPVFAQLTLGAVVGEWKVSWVSWVTGSRGSDGVSGVGGGGVCECV